MILSINQALGHILVQYFPRGHFLGLLSCQGLGEVEAGVPLLERFDLHHVLLGLEASFFSSVHLNRMDFGWIHIEECHCLHNFLRCSGFNFLNL